MRRNFTCWTILLAASSCRGRSSGRRGADRAGTIADLALVVARFKMHGDGLIPHYRERLRDSGAGISARNFVERALLPTLKMLGTNRAELKAVCLDDTMKRPV